MEKDIIKDGVNSLYRVYYLGEDLAIYNSLKDLSLKTKKFILHKKTFKESLSIENAFILLDDSSKKIMQKINFLKEKNFQDFFLLLNKNNYEIINNKTAKVFFKPLSIFNLHEEIYRSIKNNYLVSNHWKLDRSSLQLISNKNLHIQLTEKEYEFLYYLLKNQSDSVDKKSLLKKVWKIKIEDNIQIKDNRVVETLVSRIRKKLSTHNKGPKLLKLKEGYKILF